MGMPEGAAWVGEPHVGREDEGKAGVYDMAHFSPRL